MLHSAHTLHALLQVLAERSATVSPPLLPQAFISHTGVDKHDGINSAAFASGLNALIKQDGIATFIDHSNIEGGDDWSQDILKHAQQSQVMVVILTRSYFLRYWCMRELDLAMQAKASGVDITIIPVCYGIDSLDAELKDADKVVTWEKEWLAMQAAGKSDVDVQRWRANVVQLDQHHQSQRARSAAEFKDRETQFKEQVALRVFQVLPPTLQIAEVGDFVVELDESVEEVKNLLERHSVAAIVGPGKRPICSRCSCDIVAPQITASRWHETRS